jgi:tetratricopeptide (TPR) repeat protein
MRGTEADNEWRPARPVAFVGALLVLMVLVVYFPARDLQFVNYDDPAYVYANPNVLAGLTAQSIASDFTATTVANWHPLTMLSLQLDCTLFGPGPFGFHLTNVLLHAASTLLLFLVLMRMTGCIWRCAWVAAIFALHPLRVESVAWVAERKDVLSGFFWMVTLFLYARFAEKPGASRMTWATISLALGLLAKPMLVTLPFVLLLLDIWPLRRLNGPWSTNQAPLSWRQALQEKLPLFVLSALFCGIAVVAQRQGLGLRSFDVVPFGVRLQHALVAPVAYLGKMVWPVDLAAFYPLHQEGFPLWELAATALLLAGISVLCWWQRERRPYLAVGWLWFLGTLVPVIGLVQVGDQAWADRYTYLPSIGILLAVGWGLPEWLRGWGVPARINMLLAGITVVACALLTRAQIDFWRDTGALWEHVLVVIPKHGVAHNNLGVFLEEHGDRNGAIRHFSQALADDKHNDLAASNLANSRLKQGNLAEAKRVLLEALTHNPDSFSIHLMLGHLCYIEGNLSESERELREATRLNPINPQAAFMLGETLEAAEKLESAAQAFGEAVRRSPLSDDFHFHLGFVLYRLGRYAEAALELRTAIALNPKVPGYRCDLGLVLYDSGETDQAQSEYRLAFEQQPDWDEKRYAFALHLLAARNISANEMAMLQAAVKEVCQATGFNNPRFLEALALTRARNGEYTEALKVANQALALAKAKNQDDLAARLAQEINDFEKKEFPPVPEQRQPGAARSE